MKTKLGQWSTLKLYRLRYQIKPAVFQRSDVWSLKQRRLLIDSILRGIDIPKIYLEKSEKRLEWDIIDGHQRIDTIIGFLDNEFEVDGKRFREMSEKQREIIENYHFTIVEVSDIEDEEEIRLLFDRLNLGIPLNCGERLNAIKSGLGDFIKEMAKTPFIAKTRIPERRFAKEQVCAQICNNSRLFNKTGEFRNSKYEDLENLYRMYKDFSSDHPKARTILGNLDVLYEIFRGNVDLVRNRASAVSIYLFTEELIQKGKLDKKILRSFYIDFLRELKKQVSAGLDATNRFLLQFQSRIIQGADTKRAISERHESLKTAYNYYIQNHRIMSETK